jgi:hypothetical protein
VIYLFKKVKTRHRVGVGLRQCELCMKEFKTQAGLAMHHPQCYAEQKRNGRKVWPY